MRRSSLAVILILSFFFVCADGSDVIQKADDGSINWTDGTVVVTGSGAPDLSINNDNSARLFSEKVAKKNAGYRLQKILRNISLDGKITVGEYIEKRKDVTFEIPGSRTNPVKKVDRKNYSDGSVDIKLLYSIKDSLFEVCSGYREELQKKLVSTKVVRNLPVDEKVLFPMLVFEVKEKKFSPVLFPRVVSDEGKLVYGLEKQSIKDRCGRIMSYMGVYEKKDALYIKAAKVSKNGEIVISSEDELKIKTQLKDGVLKDGKVLIVLKK